jgi:putative endonuclease
VGSFAQQNPVLGWRHKQHSERSEESLLKRESFVYILASLSGTLYVGVTDDLIHRVWEHKKGKFDGFTKKYNVNRLVYFGVLKDDKSARLREIQLKGYSRAKKVALIERDNPKWEDLSENFWIAAPKRRTRRLDR